jgi:NAD(P)H-dependent FMN reductase
MRLQRGAIAEGVLSIRWCNSGGTVSLVSSDLLKREGLSMKVAIITGSTRPGRNNEAVARWVYELASTRRDAQFELVDIKDHALPLLDESVPAAEGRYSQPHTKTWAARIGAFDAYVFVTPEYNHGMSAALKNAIDYLDREWNDKAAGFVSYGAVGGARAVEQLRAVLANVKIATVHAQVMLSLFTDFAEWTRFQPHPRHQQELHTMLDQVIAWGWALRTLRTNGFSENRPCIQAQDSYERV